MFIGIATSHAFIDANKRTAFASCATFLELNGYEINADTDEIVETALRIADKNHDNRMDFPEVVDWLITVAVAAT